MPRGLVQGRRVRGVVVALRRAAPLVCGAVPVAGKKRKARYGGTGRAYELITNHMSNVRLSMPQSTIPCQLTRNEMRILAQAEIELQKRLISTLMREFYEAMQRIRKARRILAEVE